MAVYICSYHQSLTLAINANHLRIYKAFTNDQSCQNLIPGGHGVTDNDMCTIEFPFSTTFLHH